MAKRVRGQRASHRIGGQAPQRRASEATASRTLTPPVAPDLDAAIDSVFYDAELTIQEPATTVVPTKPRRGARIKVDSLDARVAAENIYVRDDLRRILFVSIVLFGALAVCWFLFVFLNVLGLY